MSPDSADQEAIRAAILEMLVSRTGDPRWKVAVSDSIEVSHRSGNFVGFSEGIGDHSVEAVVDSVLEMPGGVAAVASPDFSDQRLMEGLVTVCTALRWSHREMRALVMLLWETEVISREEASWLAGFVPHDAPMGPVPIY